MKTISWWIKLQSQANNACSLINYVVPKCREAIRWPKVPVVVGERAQSKAVPSTFLPLLQRLQGWGTLGSSLQCKIGSLGPSWSSDKRFRWSKPPLEMQLCKNKRDKRQEWEDKRGQRGGINQLCSLHSTPPPPSYKKSRYVFEAVYEGMPACLPAGTFMYFDLSRLFVPPAAMTKFPAFLSWLRDLENQSADPKQ